MVIISKNTKTKGKKPEKKKVRKEIFADHADFECDRNVFLNLSQVAKNWTKYNDWRQELDIKDRVRSPVTNQLISQRGNKYEQEVYDEIRAYGERIKNRTGTEVVRASISKQDTIYRTAMNPSLLTKYVRETQKLQCLLEHEFVITPSFASKFEKLPVAPSRPDIIMIHPLDSLPEKIKYFDKDGNFREGKTSSLQATYGLSIMDIKSIPEDRVSHKYFNEILYYLHTLNHFLQDHNMVDFVILGELNGIFPTYENVKIYDFEDLLEKMVDIDLDQTSILYENTIVLVDELVKQIPLKRTDVQQTFGSHCDKCSYLDDCLVNSGYNQKEKKWSDNVDIELLPNVNNSIISQLKEDNITTVDDLLTNLDRLGLADYPQPINSILPLLEHKTKAIQQKDVTYAKSEEIYSTSIPGYSRTKVTFTLETDSTTDLAFGFGILLESTMGRNSNAKHKELFHKWWNNWKKYLDQNEEYNKSAADDLYQTFQSIGFLNVAISDIKKFARHLNFFQTNTVGDKVSMKFIMPGDELPSGKRSRQTRIELAYVNISLNITKEAEEIFLRQVIENVSRIIQMSLILEKNIRVDNSFANTAFYYWSPEIVEKIEELLEKHMDTIVNDQDLYNDLFLISQWISPANQVTDPNQLKRIYDMSKFVESVMGMPLPINYTWHRTAEMLLTNFGYNYNYWSPLFNNMDRSHWHTFIILREENQVESNEKYKEIQSQIYSKIRTMAILVNHFQLNEMTRPLISNNPVNIPQQVRTKATDVLPMSFHPLARNWYLFATLTESVDELETVELRSTYPQEAVGKLEAARVSDLQKMPRQVGKKTKYVYQFNLKGLSRNVKFGEGSQVLLIPIEIRDSILSWAERKWRIELEQMVWNDTNQTYYVRSAETDHDLFEMADNPTSTAWFIYPTTGGYWASKLYKSRNSSTSLLVRSGLGASMLGQRLSIMWNLGSMQELPPLNSLEFPAPQVYMYAPDLMEQVTYQRPPDLLSDPELEPDPSQKEAIMFALESPLRLILGPPGTGKSQTIVALIDEFLARRHDAGRYDNKILITSFAYTASFVLLDKICQAKNSQGDPSLAAKTQKVFIMSQGRELPQLSGTGPTFKVDRLTYRSNGFDFNNERITPKADMKLDDYVTGDAIFFGNAHQVYRLDKFSDDTRILSRERLEFDLIIVDEASQLPTDHMLSIYQHVRSADVQLAWDFNYNGGMVNPVELEKMKIMNHDSLQTHVVLVGDDNQLPPVQPIKPPENLQVQLGSVFDYYKNGFDLQYRQLKFNYRSHRLIVQFTESLDIYDELLPSPVSPNKDRLVSGDITKIQQSWTRDILDPDKVVVSLVHQSQFDTSVSIFEAEVAVDIILDYYRMVDPQTEEQEIAFWYESIGIVAPHNAHSRTIINMLFQALRSQDLGNLSSDQLMTALKDTIFSVEKFQGSERDVIIGTVGVSAKDQLRAEEEFIYDLNRINVLTTRAKSKMILVCSQNFLQHIPEDRDRFFDIAILKNYTYKYCDNQTSLTLPQGYDTNTINFFWKSI